MINWKEMLEEFDDKILACTLTEEELLVEFDGSYGLSEGTPFTAWSNDWVYFPVVYDGAEWVGRAPRNICDTPTYHCGGQ